jgi:hypothetical protein
MTGYEPLKINDDGHWIAENMPAFKEEPYINSSKNYLTKLDFDLNDIEYKSLYIALTTTWEALCQYLKKSEYFGVPLRNSAYMNKVAKEINSKAKTNEDKLRLAHEFIKSYKWNKEESLYTSNSNINWALDKKSGSSADINLALVQLLDKLGFDVSPVLLSTRLNGMLSPVTPSLNKLNYVIACVNLNGEPLLMDGTEVNAPYNLLPERCLNLYGRRYDSEKCGLVDLKTDKKSKEIIYYNLTLDTGLQFTGRVNFQRFDYAALRFRNKYKNFSGKDAYLEDMLGEFPGLRIRSSSIGNIDSLYLPVKDHYDIVLKNSVEEINGSFYFYPMMLHRIKENPFKAEQRKYPIDFACNSEKTFSVTITIPENFEVTSFPESLKKTLPGNAAYFLYQVSIVGSTIQFNYKMGLNKTFFSADEYNILREFYNQIVAKQAEPIILKRKGT